MASTGVNVLRWSALGAGILYGVYHQAKLSSALRVSAANREYERKEQLIVKAKAEYAKKSLPQSSKTSEGDASRDPENPQFDLEALLNAVAAENK